RGQLGRECRMTVERHALPAIFAVPGDKLAGTERGAEIGLHFSWCVRAKFEECSPCAYPGRIAARHYWRSRSLSVRGFTPQQSDRECGDRKPVHEIHPRTHRKMEGLRARGTAN